MGDDRRAVEVQRAVGAAREDLLGRDEVAGEGEGEGLVVLAVGGEGVVAAHRVELGLGGREVLAADLDPAGDQAAEERVHLVALGGEHRRRRVEVALGEAVGEDDERGDGVVRIGGREVVGGLAGAGDVAEGDAGDDGVVEQAGVVGVERERAVEIGGGVDVVVAEVRLHGGEVGAREARRPGREGRARQDSTARAARRARVRTLVTVTDLPGIATPDPMPPESPIQSAATPRAGARRSHVGVVRPVAALGRRPVDVLERILDVAGLAVDAVLEVDLEARVGAVLVAQHLVDPGRAVALGGLGEAREVDLDRDAGSFSRRWQGWSSAWLVKEKATLVSRSKESTPSGFG